MLEIQEKIVRDIREKQGRDKDTKVK